MKRYLLILLPLMLFIFNGCKKDSGSNNSTPPIIPGISIQSISYPSFVSSTWNNVLGGNVSLEFDLLDANNSVSSKSTDSTNLNNISAYNKILTKGTYNIYISSKNQTSLADTFIRFNAQIKSYSVAAQQALSLTATTNDGLITIAQSFVQNNTVPTFKADLGSTVYKMGFINGFYYLYVKGGTTGAITFTSKASNQTITKSLSIATLNQYNLAVQTNKGSLQVVFAPFSYSQVGVGSSTLLTLNINTNDYYFINSNVYFVATDASGNVLNSVKYTHGTSTFKFSSLAPYTSDRFNFYVVIVPIISGITPSITGFLQVKKGSTYSDWIPELPQKPTFPLKPHIINSTGFDNLTMSTDVLSNYISLLSDSTNLQNLIYPADSSKLWVQMLKNNQYSYNFFTIPPGTVDLNVDLTKLTETPLMKSITSPGNGFAIEIYAKQNVNYADVYRFAGKVQIAPNQIDYYCPSEPFPEYDIMTTYMIGNFKYIFDTSGTTLPTQAPTFNASLSASGSTLADFVPSFSGTFDYYHASFLNYNSGSNLQVDLYSPSAANYTNIMLPDFSKYFGSTSLDLSTEILESFELEQYNGFNEQNFKYKNVNAIVSYPNFNCSAVVQYY